MFYFPSSSLKSLTPSGPTAKRSDISWGGAEARWGGEVKHSNTYPPPQWHFALRDREREREREREGERERGGERKRKRESMRRRERAKEGEREKERSQVNGGYLLSFSQRRLMILNTENIRSVD